MEQLQAITEHGRPLVALAEELAADFEARAGGFMHPFGLNLAFEFIGRAGLVIEPPLA